MITTTFGGSAARVEETWIKPLTKRIAIVEKRRGEDDN